MLLFSFCFYPVALFSTVFQCCCFRSAVISVQDAAFIFSRMARVPENRVRTPYMII